MRPGPFCLGYVLGAFTVLLLGVGMGGLALTLAPFFSPRPVPTPVVRAASPATPTPTVASPPPAPPATPSPAPAPGGALTPAQIVERVAPAVVQLVVGNSSGTGMVLDAAGNILTNAHVVARATTVTVRLANGRTLSGRVVARDEDRDLAIVRVSGQTLPTVRLGDSTTLRPGDDVFAIGYALNLPGEPSVSRGLVSGVREGQRTDLVYIQTDAAVNPGNSGGPLVNSRGEVVGIVTARITSDAGRLVQGVTLAIAISSARPTIDRLVSAR
jgi:S1-C subfamily serine protease